MKYFMRVTALAVFVSLLPFFSAAQDKPSTITVTGAHTHNLSPNEIIINLHYQEYFTNAQENMESKISIVEIEKLVLRSVISAGIRDDKITKGSANFIRPNRNNGFKKGRIDKALFLCVTNTDEYIGLIQQLEKDGLFDNIITQFSINNYNHTEKTRYLRESRSKAFSDAKNKAELILAEANKKVGQVMTIKEINAHNQTGNGGFYDVGNHAEDSISGFQPINISYQLEVVFEIVD
jgi:uncharacterized protein YggE